MKRIPHLLFSLFAAAALALLPAPASAWSLFGSEEGELLEQADADFDAAMKAGREGRVLDQLDGLTKAAYAYGKLSQEFPTYQSDHVRARYQEAVATLTDVNDRIASGEIAVPNPDAAAQGAGRGFVSLDSEKPAEPTTLSTAVQGIPDLVRTGESGSTVPPAAAPAEAPAEAQPSAAPAPVTDRRLTESVPNPFYVGPADSDDPSASVEVRLAPADAPAPRSREEEERMARLFFDMIRSAQASDAVILLEDEIEKYGDAAPLSLRVLYVRALLQRHNYALAAEELDRIPASSASDPSVRTLRAATCIARGELPRAMLELHSLLEEYPAYADIYVNMAYVMFLMDPVGNRSSAIEYYHVALENGAARDTRLEAELGVRIGE